MNNRLEEIDATLAARVDIERQQVALKIKEEFQDLEKSLISDDEAIVATERVYVDFNKFQSRLINWCMAFAFGMGLLFFKETSGFSIVVCPLMAVFGYIVIWGGKKGGIKQAIVQGQFAIIQINYAKASPENAQPLTENITPATSFDVPPQDN